MVGKIEFTSQECEDYIWFAKQCLQYAKVTKKSNVSAISNGNVVIICKYTPVKAILIVDAVDFYCHPKSADNLILSDYYDTDMNTYSLLTINQGGWLKKTDGTWYPLDERLIYSLLDDDSGTFGLKETKDNIQAKYVGTQNQNYGNLYWYNPEIPDSTLSWKGPPSVQFPIDNSYYISGLSQSLGKTNTLYTSTIYKAGRKKYQAPDLVVGACYTKDDKGHKYLLSFVHYKEDTKYQFRIYKTLDSGKNWTLIGSFNTTSATTTPAFISKSGKIIVYHNDLYTINDSLDQVIKTTSLKIPTDGSRTIVGTGGYGSNYTYKGTKKLWFGLNTSDSSISNNVNVSAQFISTGNGAPITSMSTKKVPSYRGNPATSVSVAVSGAAAPCSGGTGTQRVFSATPKDIDGNTGGAYCKVQWTGVDCFDGLLAVKSLPTDCSDQSYTVTCTLVPQGVSGSFSETLTASSVTVSGPEEPSDGDVYTLSNAEGSVTWSISKGTISAGGSVRVSGECGCATVTGTDSRGCSATKTIRMSSGTWVQTSYQQSDMCPACFGSGYWDTTISGSSKLYRFWQSVEQDSTQCGDGSGGCNQNMSGHTYYASKDCSTPPRTCHDHTVLNCNNCWYCLAQYTYEWWCTKTTRGW